jgi:alkylation response protein AidB-like acyl-CoA dehydrogenase
LTVTSLEKLAANVHVSCRVTLTSVRIPLRHVLGDPAKMGGAWQTLRVTGAIERLIVSALSQGLASSVVEHAVSFAKQRQQFGHPIAAFQSIQHTLVEMKTTETAMRLLVKHAVDAFESGRDATQEVCMAKFFCAEQLQHIVAKGMRVMGGRGYFEFDDMARFYREAPFSLYAGGTVEIQKMLIARSMGLGG